jgi:hypothetical protein
MFELVLILGLTIGLATFLFQILTRFATWAVAGSVESRMRAAESIVNEERIPPFWIRSYQAKRDELIKQGAGPEVLADLGRKAQSDCIKRIDDLLHFFENDRIVDSYESRIVLQKALQQAKKNWQAASWEFFLARALPGKAPDQRNSAAQS